MPTLKIFLQIVLLISLLQTAPKHEPHPVESANNHPEIPHRTPDISRASGVAPKLRRHILQMTEPQKPCADLLFISDSPASAYRGQFETSATAMGIAYEVWDVYQHRGIDASVINWGWNTIFVYGQGSNTIPILATEDDPGYGEFLSAGGHLILTDQDWFKGHGLDQYPASLTFVRGYPAWDWFGLAGAVSDPDYDNDASNRRPTVQQ